MSAHYYRCVSVTPEWIQESINHHRRFILSLLYFHIFLTESRVKKGCEKSQSPDFTSMPASVTQHPPLNISVISFSEFKTRVTYSKINWYPPQRLLLKLLPAIKSFVISTKEFHLPKTVQLTTFGGLFLAVITIMSAFTGAPSTHGPHCLMSLDLNQQKNLGLMGNSAC